MNIKPLVKLDTTAFSLNWIPNTGYPLHCAPLREKTSAVKEHLLGCEIKLQC